MDKYKTQLSNYRAQIAQKAVDVRNLIKNYTKRRSIRYGLPFVLFVVGGSFGLREVTNLRYQYRRTQQFQGKLKDMGKEMKPKEEVSLEAQYETIKDLDTDNWENKRISRPWEEAPGK